MLLFRLNIWLIILTVAVPCGIFTVAGLILIEAILPASLAAVSSTVLMAILIVFQRKTTECEEVPEHGKCQKSHRQST